MTGTVTVEQDDMLNFDRLVSGQSELIVCMTDTLVHLESKASVVELFHKVARHLEPEGQFVITFRDLSAELHNLERFIPLKHDKDTILTCFLEYEPGTVKVHDLVYRKTDGQ